MQIQEISDYLEQDVTQFNKLFTTITYQPSFYNYINKYQLKTIQMQLKSEEFLPSILINDKLAHKIQYHKQQQKQAYGLTNTFEFDSTLSIDIISYDIESTYTDKLQYDNLYPILLNFSVNHWQLNNLTTFFKSQACVYSSTNIDLLYLNQFKIALYTHKPNIITTFLYYPSIQLRLQEIRHTNKFVETPLTKLITKSKSSQKKEKVQYKFGFLSLDQSNRIFPLMIQDPLVLQLPLIGTWLYSNDPYDEPLNNKQYIWTMLTEFIISPYITKRISKDQYDQFLFIQFQKNQAPQFFEVSLKEDPEYKILRQQDSIINLDNFQIDLPSAQPLSPISQISDLYSQQKQIEQSFQQESAYKQPPIPIPQPLDSNNQSYQSANFPQNSQLTERLVLMQSEQLKLMQTQIIDLQRALLQQMQKSQVSQPQSPPRNEQTFQPQTKRNNNLPVQKIDFLSEQLKLKTQSKRKEQEIEELAQQILCDKIDSIQSSTCNSNKFVQETPQQTTKISTNKKQQSLGDLIISMKDSDIKRQIKRNQAMIQDLNEQKPQSLSPFQQQQQIQSPTFNIQQVSQFQQESPLIKTKTQVSNSKQPILISSIQKSYNKENINTNQLEQSAGSKAMPKIKFNLKDYDDSDSDEEVKKLQMKYLKKR